jgi:hypothetical protein
MKSHHIPASDKARIALSRMIAAAALGVFAIGGSSAAMADESGVSFWVPGLFGSLAAVPQQTPGWALNTIYYHTSVSAGSDVSLAREFSIGKFPANASATLNANLNATGDVLFINPTYAFATPFLGGQASVGLIGVYSRVSTSLAGTMSGTLSVPPLAPIGFSRSDTFNDSVTGVGDLYPQFAVRWNSGVNNYMTYVTGDIPVGSYDSSRLSNIGLGHGAIDGGAGYTYFDPQSGHEFSAVTGFTYNFTNPSTNYQSGVDWHLDWGASQFLSKQFSVGLVGYFYRQVSGDSGSGDRVGSFQSGVTGIGPQMAFIFPAGQTQAYLNLKVYKEFDATNRPSGWNAWAVLSLSPAAPVAAASSPPILRK